MNKIEISVDVITGKTTQKVSQFTSEEVAGFAQLDAHAYIVKRAAEYPPMADYIDGVVKGDQAQIDAYVAACLAVKAKYPKEQA